LAKRSSKQKLIGWGVFAAMIVVIAAIFFITRMLGGASQAPGVATQSVAEVASVSAAAADVSSAPTSSADAIAATSNVSVEAPAPPSTALAASAPRAASTASADQVVDAGTMSQQSRRGMLLTLIQQGVFTGVQALDTPPRVGVTALFEGLSPNLQQQFIAVVYAYINNGAAGTQTLQLIDATNGSQVGSYSTQDGLKLGQG
jgi:hypothetical protein